MALLQNLLAHPLTKGLAVDDPATTELRLRIIREKPFLRQIYDDWYGMIRARIPAGAGRVLELGSGAGYFREVLPEVIQSEVFFCRNVQLIADGCRLPFPDSSLKSIVMTDVFHHIPEPAEFLREAVRTLRRDGRIVMIEPWVSAWSKSIYTRLHHEPFLPAAEDWEIPRLGPLSGANGAMPWIVFHRDLERFQREFPELRISEIQPMMPFRYLVSGGVSMRSTMPGIFYGSWRLLEHALEPWMNHLAMFALLSIERR